LGAPNLGGGRLVGVESLADPARNPDLVDASLVIEKLFDTVVRYSLTASISSSTSSPVTIVSITSF